MQARLSNKVPRIFSSACESLEIRWFDREKEPEWNEFCLFDFLSHYLLFSFKNRISP